MRWRRQKIRIYYIATIEQWEESHINNLLYALVTLFGFAHQRIYHTIIRFIGLNYSYTIWNDTNIKRGCTKYDSFQSHVVSAVIYCCWHSILFTWRKEKIKRQKHGARERGKMNIEWTHFSTSFKSKTQTVGAFIYEFFWNQFLHW